jgi:hypothetical protein
MVWLDLSPPRVAAKGLLGGDQLRFHYGPPSERQPPCFAYFRQIFAD